MKPFLEMLDMEDIDFFPVLDQMDDGVIIADIAGFIRFYNQAQAKIDNIPVKEAMGKKVTEIYELNNRTSMIMQCINRGRAIKNEAFLYRTASGKVANTITSVYPLTSRKKITGVICFVKDYELLRKSSPPARECRSDMGNGTQFTFEDLIGSSPEFLRVKDLARKAAASFSPIMIQGETGTGKELFAQSIHNHSPRRGEKYVAVNCAAIPHDLLEGMLFGTTRGAFTGAMDKPGLFEQADNGTLFLDELLAMPVALQAKLLRAIQEKRVRRLGSVQETRVQVKIISSVSQDPRVAIQQGKLRTDLFYRLGVVMVKLPPLRERLDSLEELVGHFIEKYNLRLGTNVRRVSRDVWDLLTTYRWPGNIRELEHLIEGTMNMVTREKKLGLEHFTPGLDSLEQTSPLPDSEPVLFQDIPAPPAPGHAPPEPEPGPGQAPGLVRAQADREKAAVEQALARTGGNVTQAAQSLGISRQLLHYKIKKHGLFRADYIPRPNQLKMEN
ncbi:sigma-54 interaction domain-containing protein [Desulfospira joergensenii]|uniref:sigma-54 interaction domain-containing protein n=1 Tax=Desulfospira joergensenii TaxID=53329 RepID=UPI0003B65783|nr:sigma 54-interacting transcriptional regulator [Desulfospira joergensenii]